VPQAAIEKHPSPIRWRSMYNTKSALSVSVVVKFRWSRQKSCRTIGWLLQVGLAEPLLDRAPSLVVRLALWDSATGKIWLNEGLRNVFEMARATERTIPKSKLTTSDGARFQEWLARPIVQQAIRCAHILTDLQPTFDGQRLRKALW